MDTESSSTITHGNSTLYQAIKDNKMDDIKLLLDDGRGVNDPIITTGPYSGFTALHVACMEDYYLNDDLIKLLIEDYKADVNVIAEDGTQPIHLACFIYEENEFRRHIRKIKMLFKANANVNAEFGQEIFSKYVKDKEWCPDFGDQMSLLIYAVIYRAEILAIELVCNGANVEIKSLTTNKTLLMYAIDNNDNRAARCIAKQIKAPEILYHCDNDGIPATHYLLRPKKYGEFRYDENEQWERENKGDALGGMIGAGVDLNALLNDDPETFLLNMATYRSCRSMLQELLPAYDSITHSKALYLATLPVDENSDKYIRFHSDDPWWTNASRIAIQELRTKSLELILKDLVNRRTFGLPVPDGEKKLMDKLIATDTNIRNIVKNYKRDFIEGELQKKFIEFGDKSMTRFDFLMEVYDDRKLKILMRNENFQDEAWYRIDYHQDLYGNYCYFDSLVHRRIKYAGKRLELLEKLKKIAQLTDAIPLPYELILDIVDYLPNKDFESLINAFVST